MTHTLNVTAGLSSRPRQRQRLVGAFIWSEPMAAPPLHLPDFGRFVPAIARPLHLPDLQQGILSAKLAADPQPLPHRREAFQVPTRRVREGLQREEQHEATRARLPQLRERQPAPMSETHRSPLTPN